jgi:multicomponent Na+:H+ antiporter subunit D
MLLKGIFLSGQWWWAPVVLAGSLLTAGYVFMLLRLAFAPAREMGTFGRVPKSLEVVALLLALGSFLIVFPADYLVQFLESSEVFGSGVESIVEGGAYGND